MSYGDFTLADLVQTFGITLEETRDLFREVPEVSPSDWLRQTLEDSVPLALAMNTEKGRSEFIIAPVLLELRRLRRGKIAVFSGVEFTVDPESGLRGACDFLITRSPEQLFIRAPVLTVVEAKKESIHGGLGQCIAEMLASQRFNARAGIEIGPVYGAVTTGNTWKFLQLEERTAFIDLPEYHISGLPKILGILCHMTR